MSDRAIDASLQQLDAELEHAHPPPHHRVPANPLRNSVRTRRPQSRVPTPETHQALVAGTFVTVPDFAWIDIAGPTLIGLYPVVSNEEIEKDEGLAGALDDSSFHPGTAQDSLKAAGFAVGPHSGDTLWLRTHTDRSRVVRVADRSTGGCLSADTLLRRVFVYGVRGGTDLVAYAHEFKRTGTVKEESR